MRQASCEMRAWDDTQAAIFFIGTVQMDACSKHRMLFMREIRIVLMHREGSAVLGRFD
ncbi:hypothetical protein D3C86_2073040 [compost metagenome]